jgi:hypothetical protein
MKNTSLLMIAALLLAGLFSLNADQADRKLGWDDREGAFSFALIGDMPYGPASLVPFDRVIGEINADKSIRFVLHAGDIKSGGERCDDSLIQSRFALYQKFRYPFIYTPGDNEWTDCHRVAAGQYNPLERLAFLRKTFFPDPDFSTGGRRMRVISQSHSQGYREFIENVWFRHRQILFATVHVIGSNNNLEPWSGIDAADSVATPRPDRLAEFTSRQAASLAWLEEVFRESKDCKGIFLAMQADPRFDLKPGAPERTGFDAFLSKLETLVLASGKSVVLSQGDSHVLIIDQPLPTVRFTRLQTFGENEVHWVKIRVDPKSASVFSFEPRVIAANIR